MRASSAPGPAAKRPGPAGRLSSGPPCAPNSACAAHRVSDRPVRILLDASAIVAFCRGTSVDVGEVNDEVNDEGAAAGLPLLCLVEGRRAIADTDLLDVLVT